MNETRGLVTDTIAFSNVDGPGNRFAIFLQGCNLDCLACHNPYTIGVCNDCGDCVEPCPSEALSITAQGVVWDADSCEQCDTCIDVCPIDATPKATRRTVESLLADIGRAAPFLSGITVSGGEATLQVEFVHALFSAVKQHRDPRISRLTCMVDTNGMAEPKTWTHLAPVTDGVMVDLKAFDPELHTQMTGSPNDEVLASIAQLSQMGLLHEVRMLIVAGMNDDEELIRRSGQWLAGIDPSMRLKVMGYRAYGVRPHDPPLVEPSRNDTEKVAAVLAQESPTFDIVVV
ncbi:MAG: YjjW family glycine radical enzyme activase [Acidimicrobiales bacterium]